jgi:hypothetical protein
LDIRFLIDARNDVVARFGSSSSSATASMASSFQSLVSCLPCTFPFHATAVWLSNRPAVCESIGTVSLACSGRFGTLWARVDMALCGVFNDTQKLNAHASSRTHYRAVRGSMAPIYGSLSLSLAFLSLCHSACTSLLAETDMYGWGSAGYNGAWLEMCSSVGRPKSSADTLWRHTNRAMT